MVKNIVLYDLLVLADGRGLPVSSALAKNKAEIVNIEIGEDSGVLRVSFFHPELFYPE